MNKSLIRMFSFFVIALLSLGSCKALHAESRTSAIEQELGQLDWQYEGTYMLPKSHSTFALPADHILVIGEDSQRLSSIIGNSNDKSIEAIAMDEKFDTTYFSYHDVGYVSLDDWNQIDAKKLLQEISDNTEESNKNRRRQNLSELHVIRWLQEPTLDRHTNTVFWAIEAEDGAERMVNSVAIRLGRKGFEQITWVSNRDSYTPFGGKLDEMLRAHSFDPGYRYADVAKGDKIATYGIAGLVAATVGAKVIKATGLLFLLKKFGVFIFAGLSALIYKIRNKLTGLFRK